MTSFHWNIRPPECDFGWALGQNWFLQIPQEWPESSRNQWGMIKTSARPPLLWPDSLSVQEAGQGCDWSRYRGLPCLNPLNLILIPILPLTLIFLETFYARTMSKFPCSPPHWHFGHHRNPFKVSNEHSHTDTTLTVMETVFHQLQLL